VQQRFFVTSLELVGTNQEPVWMFWNFFGDLVAGKTVQLAFRHHLPFDIRFTRERDDSFVRALDLFQVAFDASVLLHSFGDPATDHHRPRFAAYLSRRQNVLLKMVDHDFRFQANRVIVAFDVLANFFCARFRSNIGSVSTTVSNR
jgi:hypothetical protein